MSNINLYGVLDFLFVIYRLVKESSYLNAAGFFPSRKAYFEEGIKKNYNMENRIFFFFLLGREKKKW